MCVCVGVCVGVFPSVDQDHLTSDFMRWCQLSGQLPVRRVFPPDERMTSIN